MKNQALLLKENLIKRLPSVHIDASNANPDHPNGCWFIDIRFNGRIIVAEWHPNFGIALSSADVYDGFGSGHHEFYETADDASVRIFDILISGEQTSPTDRK